MKTAIKLSQTIAIIFVLLFTSNLAAQENNEGLIKVFNSKQGFSETINTIKTNAEKSGWVILDVKMMHKNLAKAGYNVVKYVPYGPIESVVPYLMRRAEENTSIAGQSSREFLLIKKELKRRRALSKQK